MSRAVLIFLILWFIFGMLFSTWRRWSPNGAWKLSKVIGFAFFAAFAATCVLGLLVLLF